MKKLIIIMLSLIGLMWVVSGCDDKKKPEFSSCDPAEVGACGDTGACVALGDGK